MTDDSKNIPLSQQIREKLVRSGAESLTDAELLSIILTEKTGKESSVDLASRLLDHFDGSLSKMRRSDLSKLRTTEALGIQRAALLAAALELGSRLRADETFMRDVINSDQDIIEMFQPRLGDLPHEEFWAVYLSGSNRVLDKVRISQGGVDGTVVDHRLIVKRAVEKLASGIILVHNHPSGNHKPSEKDNLSTEKLTTAASLFDITVADHVIITAGECYSYRRNKFFDNDKKWH